MIYIAINVVDVEQLAVKDGITALFSLLMPHQIFIAEICKQFTWNKIGVLTGDNPQKVSKKIGYIFIITTTYFYFEYKCLVHSTKGFI